MIAIPVLAGIPTFTPHVLNLSGAADYKPAVVADVVGDGGNELVVISNQLHKVLICRASGAGVVTVLQQISIAGGFSLPWTFVSPQVADMDGDGRRDIVTWQRSNGQKGRLFVFFQTAPGTWTQEIFPTPDTDAAYSMALADVTSDGLPEVITANHGHSATATVFVLYNGTGPARFTTFDALSGGSARINNVYSLDLNQDGKADVVGSTHPFGAFGVSVFYNSGVGLSLATIVPGTATSLCAGVGDLNSDGLADLITTDSIPHGVLPTINVFSRTLAGYQSPLVLSPGMNPHTVQVADYDGDGRNDLLVDLAQDRVLALYPGDPGTGGITTSPTYFSFPELLAADHAATSVIDTFVVGDVDNDGDIDIIFATDTVIWLRNGPVDSTPPTITPAISGTLGTNGWYTSNVSASWTVADPDSPVTSTTGCDPTAITTDTAGVTLTCSATSTGGTASQSVTIKRDATPPTVAITGVTNGGTYPLGSLPAAGCTTTDALSGVATNATASVTGGTANRVGSFTATCSGATDNAGNPAAPITATYSVQYNFLGFFSPINMGILNVMKAGQSAPMKWRLTDASGAYVSTLSAVLSLNSAAIPCSGGPTDPVEVVDTSGNSGLRYDASSNQYIFTWQTAKPWAGTCRRFLLSLDDGTTKSADFQLR